MPIRPAPASQRALIEDILAQPEWDGNQTKLARAIGMTVSAMGRVRKGLYPLSVRSCLLLAEAAGLDPGEVLAACGKVDVHQQILELYGAAPTLTRGERRHLDRWRQLTPEAREAVERLLPLLTPPPPKKTTKRK